jgi:NADP-reducing hydrogenase subunit HndB
MPSQLWQRRVKGIMSTIQSLEDLERFRQEILAENKKRESQGIFEFVVGMGSCGIAAGACDTYDSVRNLIEKKKLDKIRLSQTGCIGLCKEEPLVEIHSSDGRKTTYGHVTPAVAARIIEEHILAGKPVQDHLINF